MRGQAHVSTGRRSWCLPPVVLLIVLQGAVASAGQALLSREEALSLAFPGASVRSERVFLTEAQQQQAADVAKVDIPTRLVARYLAARDGTSVGRAYVDTHVVRTKRESLLISLDADGRVSRIDVVAFMEPEEYRAPSAFLGQYSGKALDEELHLNRAVRPIAGATLTARAVNAATRRVLAIDEVLGRAKSRGDGAR